MVLEAEHLVHIGHEVDHPDNLLLDLGGQHKDVGIVLGESPDAHEPVEGAGELMAVHQAHLRHADGQIL